MKTELQQIIQRNVAYNRKALSQYNELKKREAELSANNRLSIGLKLDFEPYNYLQHVTKSRSTKKNQNC